MADIWEEDPHGVGSRLEVEDAGEVEGLGESPGRGEEDEDDDLDAPGRRGLSVSKPADLG